MDRQRWLLVTAAVLVVAGCGSDSESAKSSAEPTPSSATAAAGVKACDLVTAEERASLLGAALAEPDGSSSSQNCAYSSSSAGDYFYVKSFTAGQWSKQLPDALDQMVASPALGEEDRAKISEAQDILSTEGELPAEQACTLFSQMAAMNGSPQDSEVVVNVLEVSLPDPQTAITGQVCADGRFTSILFSTRSLTFTPEIVSQAEDVVRAAHGRALAAPR